MDNHHEDVFDSLLAIAATTVFDREYRELNDNKEYLDSLEFSVQHENRMRKLFAVNRRETYLRAGKRAAIIVLVLINLIFVAIMTDADVRAALKNVFVEIFEGYSQFSSTVEPAKGDAWAPGYLPSDYSVLRTNESSFNTRIVYSSADAPDIIFSYTSASSEIAVNTDGVDYELLTHDGVEYHLLIRQEDADEYNSIIWEKDGYFLDLASLLDMEVLKEIAFSTKKLK